MWFNIEDICFQVKTSDQYGNTILMVKLIIYDEKGETARMVALYNKITMSKIELAEGNFGHCNFNWMVYTVIFQMS